MPYRAMLFVLGLGIICPLFMSGGNVAAESSWAWDENAPPIEVAAPLDLTKVAAAWRFNEGSGTVASDSSGKGNTGTIYNATWTASELKDYFDNPSYSGRALYFSGNNDYVEAPDSSSLDISDEIAIEAWVKPQVWPSALGSANNPALDCTQVLAYGMVGQDGLYWLDPNGGNHSDMYQAYCDMTTGGGGWELTYTTKNFMAVSDNCASNVPQSGQVLSKAKVTSITQTNYDVKHYVPNTATRLLWQAIDPTGVSKWWVTSVPSILLDNVHATAPVAITLYQKSSNATMSPNLFWEGSSNYPTLDYFTIGINGQSCTDSNIAWGAVCYTTDDPSSPCNGKVLHKSIDGVGTLSGPLTVTSDTRYMLLFKSASVGGDAAHAGRSCLDILLKGGSSGDGSYWIDPDGPLGGAAFQTFCDMTTDGGGWTRGMTMIAGDTSSCDTSNRWLTLNAITSGWGPGGEVMSSYFNVGQVRPSGTPISKVKFQPGPYVTLNTLFRFPGVDDGWDYSGSAVFNLTVLSGTAYSNAIWWDWGGLPGRKANYCIGTSPSHQACLYEGSYHGACGQIYHDGAWQTSNAAHELYVREFSPSSIGTWNQVVDKGGAYGLRVYGQQIVGTINGQTITAPVTREWNHVVLTYNRLGGSNNMNLYINGILKTQKTLTGAITLNNNTLQIGKGFRGMIDEVDIYSSALTANEIQSRYYQVSGGVLGRWKFDKGYGTTLEDLSGNESHGTISGARWIRSTVSDQFETFEDSGNALSFDGNDSVTGSKQLGFTGDFSITAWVYPTVHGDWQTIFSQQGSESKQFSLKNGKLAWWKNSSNWGEVGSVLPLNTWTYVAAVYSNSSQRLAFYANARLAGTVTIASYTSDPSSFVIGAWSTGDNYQDWVGALDDVTVFNRAVSDWELMARYRRVSWDMVGRWKMDESSGSTVADSSGVGVNGTATGTTIATSTLASSQGGAPTGNMRSFAGNGNYVMVPMALGNVATIEAWAINPTGATNNMIWCIDHDLQGPDIYFSAGKISLNIWDGASNPFVDIPSNINLWHHYTTVISPWDTSLYIDGVRVGGATYRNPTGTSFYIASGGTHDWSGSIENVAVYNRALTAQEVYYKANLIRQSGFPIASINLPANEASFAANASVTFTTTGSSDLYGVTPGIASYFWDFDDGTAILKRDSSVVVTYATPGVKTVKLWVIDKDGNPSILGLGTGLVNITITPASTLFQRVENIKYRN